MSWLTPPPLVKKPKADAWLPSTVKRGRYMTLTLIVAGICTAVAAAIGFGVATLVVRVFDLPAAIRPLLSVLFAIFGWAYGSLLTRIVVQRAAKYGAN